MCGWILEHAARGPVVITPSELLREVNLSVEPIAALAQIHERVDDCLRAAHRQLNYDPLHDLRSPAHWDDDKRVLIFAGDSGQGKTWQLAKTAQHAALLDLV